MRAEAAGYLAQHPAERARYVKRRRLTALQLLGGLTSRAAFLHLSPRGRRIVRRLRGRAARA